MININHRSVKIRILFKKALHKLKYLFNLPNSISFSDESISSILLWISRRFCVELNGGEGNRSQKNVFKVKCSLTFIYLNIYSLRTRDQEVVGSSSGALYWMENCCNAMKENEENKGSQMRQTSKNIKNTLSDVYGIII